MSENQKLNCNRKEFKYIFFQSNHESDNICERDIVKKYFTRWKVYTVQQKKKSVVKLQISEHKQKIITFLDNLKKQKKQVIRKENEISIKQVPCESTEPKTSKVRAKNSTNRRALVKLQKNNSETKFSTTINSSCERKKETIQKKLLNSQRYDSKSLTVEIEKSVEETLNEINKFRPKGKFAPKHIPFTLKKFEQKAKVREKIKLEIQAKKKIIEDERKVQIVAAEEEAKLQRIKEKQLEMEKIKERRRIEAELKERKALAVQKSKELNFKADNHYKRILMIKYCVRPFKLLIEQVNESTGIADNFYKKRLQYKYFQSWYFHSKYMTMKRANKACDHYDRKILTTALKLWQEHRKQYLRKMQVAEDFYEIKLLEKAFIVWHRYSCSQHLYWGKITYYVSKHYKRKLLYKYFQQWTLFPNIIKHEREKEMRKTKFRQAVQQILPNYQPIINI